MHDPVSLNTKFTLSILVVAVPLFVWAGGINSRVEKIEQDRQELRQELREMSHKLDDIRDRLPVKRQP